MRNLMFIAGSALACTGSWPVLFAGCGSSVTEEPCPEGLCLPDIPVVEEVLPGADAPADRTEPGLDGTGPGQDARIPEAGLPDVGRRGDVGDPLQQAPLTAEELTPQELADIALLRKAVGQGLMLTRAKYVEEVALKLQAFGLAPDYLGIAEPKSAALDQQPEACPFAKYYDNGFQPTGQACDYLADLAKVEVYSELSALLDANPLPDDVRNSPIYDQALFWYEQGAVSGIEEQRALVRYDLKQKGLCGAKPTPVQGSYDKGLLVGRQLFAIEINKWLYAIGLTPDYPKLTTPIAVCNTDQAVLEPAWKAAVALVETKAQQIPLCQAQFEPPTQEAAQQLAQAEVDYRKGIRDGVDAENAVAAATVFEIVPCNVSDPLVLDLDGNGIELLPIHRGVDFDLWGVGRKQAMAWIGPDDAFLAMDRNANGRVDDGTELFGNTDGRSADGLAALAREDRLENGGNGDGRVSPEDRAFARLCAWRDRDADGVSDPGELVTLAELRVATIDLDRAAALGPRPIPLVDVFLHSAPHARSRK